MGYPLQYRLLGDIVLIDSCMTADAFATVFMGLDLEKFIEPANSTNDVEVNYAVSLLQNNCL